MGKNLAPHQKAEQFYSRYSMGTMLLYVGQTVTKEEMRQLAKQKWACIFTCHSGIWLQEIFKEAGRQTRYLMEDIPYNPAELLCGNNQPLLIVPMKREKSTGKVSVDPKALRAMANLVDNGLNTLMVVGYDHKPDEYGDDVDLIERFLEEEDPERTGVVFWGIKDPQMQSVLESTGVDCNEERLCDILKEEEQEDDLWETRDSITDTQYFFFANGRPVNAPSGTALTKRTKLGVLTQAQMELVRPRGKYDFQQKFNNFLERSGSAEDGPQWYGYSMRCNFSVKRDIEDALVALTKNALEGRWPGRTGEEKDEVRNILLEGDPGSGKSVTLAALAYRIFQERQHPVIFVRNNVSASELSDMLDAVKGACGENYPRILVVWDCSAYTPNAYGDIKELQKLLENRYHRFVLVCSTYSLPRKKEKEEHYSYTPQGGFVREQEPAVVARSAADRDGFRSYFLHLSRELSEPERKSLWNKFRTHSAIEPARLKLWEKRLEADNDLFQICYKMINLLRANFKRGLQDEHDKVSGYVHGVLAKALSRIETDTSDTAFAAAWEAAGLDLSKFGITKEAKEPTDVEALLQKVDIRIAMFSRFEKMEVPYSYVKHLLVGKNKADRPQQPASGKLRIVRENHDETLVYSDDAGENDLFRLITTEIPWLRCGENENGEFTCSFRNPLEAELFLESCDVSAQQQVEILVEMLDYYADCLRTGSSISPLFVVNLGKLLRNMGPNSRHPAYAKGGTKSGEYAQLKEYMYMVLDPLEEICSYAKQVNPHYVCDYVTFVREEYAPQAGEPLSEEGLQMYMKVVELAGDKIQAMDDEQTAANNMSRSDERRRKGIYNYSSGLLDTLRNEWAMCYSNICNYWATFLRSDYEGEKPAGVAQWTRGRMEREYRTIYETMKPILDSFSKKGLYYNTLFKSFLDLYDFFSEENRLKFSNQLRQYVDACMLREMENDDKGRKNMALNIHRINEKDEKSEYTVDTLLRVDAGETDALPGSLLENYQISLQKEDPALLILACSRLLRNAKVFTAGNDPWNKENMTQACAKAYKLLSAHPNCVRRDAYALWLLIFTMWVSINGQSLYSKAEPRKSKLTLQQWNELHNYCKDYCQMEDMRAKADVCLLYALSACYVKSFRTCRQIMDSYRQPMENNEGDRKRHPYRLCAMENGTTSQALRFSGMMEDGEYVSEVSVDDGTYNFRLNGLDRAGRTPKPGTLVEVEIGLGYAGMTAYLVSDKNPGGR